MLLLSLAPSGTPPGIRSPRCYSRILLIIKLFFDGGYQAYACLSPGFIVFHYSRLHPSLLAISVRLLLCLVPESLRGSEIAPSQLWLAAIPLSETDECECPTAGRLWDEQGHDCSIDSGKD
jgi:hypothetical protein